MGALFISRFKFGSRHHDLGGSFLVQLSQGEDSNSGRKSVDVHFVNGRELYFHGFFSNKSENLFNCVLFLRLSVTITALVRQEITILEGSQIEASFSQTNSINWKRQTCPLYSFMLGN